MNFNPTILYEDESIIILNKPASMLSHPNNNQSQRNQDISQDSDENSFFSVAEFIKDKIDYSSDLSLFRKSSGGTQEVDNSFSNYSLEKHRLGIVHRLDKDTSGIMVCSKNWETEQILKRQFQKREISKKYFALVEGTVYQAQDTISMPIAVDHQNKLKRKVDFNNQIENSREAITHYQVKERFKEHTLLDVSIETGRTHQIRIHFKSIGHPVVGDRLYNRKKRINQNQIIFASNKIDFFLIAYHLAFQHPKTKKYLEFSIDPPNFFNEGLVALRKNK